MYGHDIFSYAMDFFAYTSLAYSCANLIFFFILVSTPPNLRPFPQNLALTPQTESLVLSVSDLYHSKDIRALLCGFRESL